MIISMINTLDDLPYRRLCEAAVTSPQDETTQATRELVLLRLPALIASLSGVKTQFKPGEEIRVKKGSVLTPEQREAYNNLGFFKDCAPFIDRIESPLLQSLTKEQQIWVLSLISPETSCLNLDGCHIKKKYLRRFGSNLTLV